VLRWQTATKSPYPIRMRLEKFVLGCGQMQIPTLMVPWPLYPCCKAAVLTYSSAVTFDAESVGRIAMVIYEFTDVRYLGKITNSDGNPVGLLSHH
jgi:hypothetical protein